MPSYDQFVLQFVKFSICFVTFSECMCLECVTRCFVRSQINFSDKQSETFRKKYCAEKSTTIEKTR